MEHDVEKKESGRCTTEFPSEYFNCIIGHIEDIVISSEFQKLQTDFLNKHYSVFTHDEENRICYMDIFNEYTTLIEEFILSNLKKQIQNIDLDCFLKELRTIGTQFDGEIYELLFSLSDFQTFKMLMLDFKDYKLNKCSLLALNDCIVVTKLN